MSNKVSTNLSLINFNNRDFIQRARELELNQNQETMNAIENCLNNQSVKNLINECYMRSTASIVQELNFSLPINFEECLLFGVILFIRKYVVKAQNQFYSIQDTQEQEEITKALRYFENHIKKKFNQVHLFVQNNNNH